MTKVHKNLLAVPTDWETKDLEAYKGDIKKAVISMTETNYNPYAYSPFFKFFEKVANWREKGDCYDIIYAYYLEFEPDNVIDALWEKVPLPGDLQDLYFMLSSGLSHTSRIQVGMDMSAYLYYYYKAKLLSDAIENGDNELHKRIYEECNFAYNIRAYLYIGDQVDNIAYVYHVNSLVGDKQYEEFLNKYLAMVDFLVTNGKLDFTLPEK
jgi:hypothetical protein